MPQTFWYSTPPALRIEVAGGDIERSIEMQQPYALVGSHERCDIVLPDASIANRALLLIATSKGTRAIILSERSKRSGTILTVKPDRPLKVGPYTLRVEANTAEVATDTTTEDPPPSTTEQAGSESNEHETPRAVHTLTWKEQTVRKYAQLADQRPLIIGRKAPSHVRIQDNQFSGVHCCAFRAGNRMWIIDLASTNGVSVSSKPIQCSEVRTGKSFRVGSIRVHYTQLHTEEATASLQLNAQLRSKDADATQTAIEELEAKTNGLQQEVGAAINAAQRQLATIAQLETERDALRTTITELESKRDEDAARIADQQVERAKLRTTIAELEAQREDHQSGIAKLEANRSRLESERATLEAERTRLESERDEHRATIAELTQAQQRQLEQGQQAETERLNQIAALQNQLDEMQTNQLETLQAKLESSDRELTEAWTELTRLSDIESQMNAQQTQLNELNELTTRAESLQEELDRRDQSIAELLEQTEALSTRDAEVQRLQEELTAAHAEREATRQAQQQRDETIEALQNEKDELTARLNVDAPEHVRMMEQALQEREAELEKLRDELVAERQVLHSLNQEIKPVDVDPGLASNDDEEACITSLDFQNVLEAALDALPAIDETPVARKPR